MSTSGNFLLVVGGNTNHTLEGVSDTVDLLSLSMDGDQVLPCPRAHLKGFPVTVGYGMGMATVGYGGYGVTLGTASYLQLTPCTNVH